MQNNVNKKKKINPNSSDLFSESLLLKLQTHNTHTIYITVIIYSIVTWFFTFYYAL